MLRDMIDRFFGRGDAAVTIPPMDGALRPNQKLEEARLAIAAPAPDNLVVYRGEALFSSGRDLRKIETGAVVHTFDRPISCAAAADDGRLAIGLAGGDISVLHPDGSIATLSSPQNAHATALAFHSDALVLCRGSAQHAPDQWKLDLMEAGAGSGSVTLIPREGASRILAEGLRWPFGALSSHGRIIISESWAHRLLVIDPARAEKPKPVLSDLPGYPARLASGPNGATWLALFAPRSQLIEFVLREDGYRRRMMNEIDPDYWIAPALANGRSFLEPLQGGAMKQMGVLKPWAPSRSYGLIVKLDAACEPALSLHSRADGLRHGTTSVLEHEGVLFVASKGGDAIIALPVEELSEP